MASRNNVKKICTCENGHVSNSQYSSESSLDTNDCEFHRFSSTETLSEISVLPTHQPVGNRGNGKSRADLYTSPVKIVQTKRNLLGTASATRLNVSQGSSGQEYLTASGTPLAPTSLTKKSKMGDRRTSKVTFKETDIKTNDFNHSGGDAKESITGMSKWKYPRQDSFIVDLNNPTTIAEEQIEEVKDAPIYANIQARKLSDVADETDEKKTVTKSTTSVFYPSKSPLRQYGKKPDSPKNPIFNVNEKLLITYAFVIAVIVACIMYFVLLGYLIENRNGIQELRSELAKLQCKNVTSGNES